ncbi:MAG: ABC transporter substrate-binding protein [Candidatus Woesearchaeota archaeon]
MKTTIMMLIVAILALTACTSHTESDLVKIGAAISLSGPAAAAGHSTQQAMDLAAREINANGGINGRPLQIIYEDDNTDSKTATTAFTKLVTIDNVDAVIGGTWDFTYDSMAPLAEQYKRTLITTQNPTMKGLTRNDYTVFMLPGLAPMTKSLSKYMQEKGIKRVAVVHFASNWGNAVTEGMRDVMDETGGELVLEETYTTIGGNDFGTIMQKIKKSEADAVFIDMVGSDVLNFLQRMRETNTNISVLSYEIVADFVGDPHVNQELLNGLVYFDFSILASDSFTKDYEKAYNEKPKHSADKAYDAVYVLAEALMNVAPEDVPSYIEGRTFTTKNGQFTFRDLSVPSRVVYVQQIQDGKITTLETVTVTE